jgi:hypothetical protein
MAIAWVSPTSPDGGAAEVFVDGRYMGTVDLTSVEAQERQVVFTHRFSRLRRHHIVVKPVDGTVDVSVDAFVKLR